MRQLAIVFRQGEQPHLRQIGLEHLDARNEFVAWVKAEHPEWFGVFRTSLELNEWQEGGTAPPWQEGTEDVNDR